MKSFTKEQAIKIASDFQEYIGFSNATYVVTDIVIAPTELKARMDFMEQYRKEKVVFIDGDEVDVVVTILTGRSNEMDMPIREFAKTHNIDYTFPAWINFINLSEYE